MNDPQGPEAAPAAAPPHDPWAGWPDWADAPATGWGWEPEPAPGPPPAPPRRPAGRRAPGQDADADLFLAVHAGPGLRRVRRQYRRFVVPAALAFLLWYLTYVVTATVAPGLMGRQVHGPVNVALLAGLGQFATTFLLTWACARHARLRRDQATLDLRWDIAMQTRRADPYGETRRTPWQEPRR